MATGSIQLRPIGTAPAVIPMAAAELQRIFADPQIPDQVKFEMTAQGFIYSQIALDALRKQLQESLKNVGQLQAVAAEEHRMRVDLVRDVGGLRAENQGLHRDVQVLTEQSDKDRATIAAGQLVIGQLEQRSEAEQQIIAGQQAHNQREEIRAKKKLMQDFDAAYDRITAYEISASVLTGSLFFAPLGIFLFKKYADSQREAACLIAQYHLFDELKPMTNEAERSLRINAFANKWLRDQGYLARMNGTQTFPNDRTFKGEFVDPDTLIEGVLTGPGKFWYQGPSYNGLPHGKGQERSLKGGTYVGEYQHGMRHGQGFSKHPSGATYYGQYREGKFHGHGVYRYANGKIFRGEFVNGNPQGENMSDMTYMRVLLRDVLALRN